MSDKVQGKQAHHTKSGPGRKHQQGDGSRTAKQKSAGSFGRGLRNWIRNTQAALQAARLAKLQGAM